MKILRFTGGLGILTLILALTLFVPVRAATCAAPPNGQTLTMVSWPVGVEIYYTPDRPSGQVMPSSGSASGYRISDTWWAVCNEVDGKYYVLNLPTMAIVQTSPTYAQPVYFSLGKIIPIGVPVTGTFLSLLFLTVLTGSIIPAWEALRSRRRQVLTWTIIGVVALIAASLVIKNNPSPLKCYLGSLCINTTGLAAVATGVSLLLVPLIAFLIRSSSGEIWGQDRVFTPRGTASEVDKALSEARAGGSRIAIGPRMELEDGSVVQKYATMKVTHPQDMSLLTTWLLIVFAIAWLTQIFLGLILPSLGWIDQLPIGIHQLPWVAFVLAWLNQGMETAREMKEGFIRTLLIVLVMTFLGIVLSPLYPGPVGAVLWLGFQILYHRRGWNQGVGDGLLFIGLTHALLYSGGITWLLGHNPLWTTIFTWLSKFAQ